MLRSFSAYLYDIERMGEAILETTNGLDREAFPAKPEQQFGIERRFEIIGEALTQARQHFAVETKQLGDVQPMIDFRNFLAHRYDQVSPVVLSKIIQDDLPPLLSLVRGLLAKLQD